MIEGITAAVLLPGAGRLGWLLDHTESWMGRDIAFLSEAALGLSHQLINPGLLVSEPYPLCFFETMTQGLGWP